MQGYIQRSWAERSLEGLNEFRNNDEVVWKDDDFYPTREQPLLFPYRKKIQVRVVLLVMGKKDVIPNLQADEPKAPFSPLSVNTTYIQKKNKKTH